MLDFNTAIEILKKYGYTSTGAHPYIYQNNNAIGVSYSFIDDKYGFLERVALFQTKEEMDDFLKKYQWFKQNGKENDVRMLFDKYDTPSPNILYYRKGKLMAADEMFKIKEYEEKEEQKEELSVVTFYIDSATKLMAYYEEIKNKEINYLKSLKELLKEHKEKYYELQLLIDKYNTKVKTRKIVENDNIAIEAGINLTLERALKEKLSQYRSEAKDRNEVITLIREIFDLCMNLELNQNYLQCFVLEHDTKNDIALANAKIDYMNRIIKNKDNLLLTKDLTKEFTKIDKKIMSTQSSVIKNFVERCSNAIKQKYSYYDIIDPLKIVLYLEEVKTNKNYQEVANKYKIEQKQEEKIELYDYEDVIKDLNEQFVNIPIASQNELIYYFSYPDIFSLISDIPDYETLPTNSILEKLQSNPKWDEVKKKVFDDVKNALEIPKNEVYKKSLFASIDFASLESYLTSLINILNNLKTKKELMIKVPTEVYFVTPKYDTLEQLQIVNTTLDIGYINGRVAGNNSLKAVLASLNKGVYVLYSDRVVEFINDNDLEFKTKLRENKTLAFNISNTTLQRVKDPIIVIKYNSNIIKEGNISIVKDLSVNAKNEYYKVIFNNKG